MDTINFRDVLIGFLLAAFLFVVFSLAVGKSQYVIHQGGAAQSSYLLDQSTGNVWFISSRGNKQVK